MRSAPPTVPGTPISPSSPPRLCFAQSVTMRPRSAAASTIAKFPWITTSGSGCASCSTTNGSSPSATSRLEPPPRNSCRMPYLSSRLSNSGIVSCLVIRKRSVVPPMPSEVFSASDAPGSTSTPNSVSAEAIWGSSRRIPHSVVDPQLRAQQHHELSTRPAHVARPNRQNCVSGSGFAQQKLDGLLHRTVVMHVLMPRLANAVGERLARHARNRTLAGPVNVQQHQNVRLIERQRKFIPQMLGAREPVRLKEHQQPVELTSPRGFERHPDLCRVMSVVIHHRNVVDAALDVESPPNACKLRQSFADQVARHVQIQRHSRRRSRIPDVVNSRWMRQVKHPKVLALVRQSEFALESQHLNIADQQVGLARRSVRDDGPFHIRNDGLHVRFVQAENYRPIKRHPVHKLHKSALNILKRNVLVQVLPVDRRHHRHHRRKHQEAAVALIRFDHEIFTAPHTRRRSGLVYPTAHDERRVQVRRCQD